jgi:hypothetical protein
MINRWMAEIYYVDGAIEIVAFEEIEQLGKIIEQGPNWNSIDKIMITLNRSSASPKREYPI